MSSLTVEKLRAALTYDANSGLFYSIEFGKPNSRSGKPAGHVEKATGYRRIRVCGKRYPAYRLAWFYVHGEWPPEFLDHINGDRDDNRIVNLRPATLQQNSFNRRSSGKNKLKGAHWNRFRNYWQSYIRVNGRSIRLGRFETAEEAHSAYCRAARKYHGEFARFS